MRFLLIICLLFFATTNLSAQGVLVAWELGKAPATLELVATKHLPAKKMTGQRLPSLPNASYELFLYQVVDRQQRLSFLRQLSATKEVRFFELDAEVINQSTVLAPSYFEGLGLVDARYQPIQYPCIDFPIAIVDTGINVLHPAFKGTVFNFNKNYLSLGNKEAKDDDGHGTHVAGLIAALPTNINANLQGNSGSVAGICSSATLHNMKVLPANSKGNVSDIYLAFIDILSQGAERFPIINASIETSQGLSLQGVIKQLSNNGHFIVAAAGNDSRLIDTSPSYPAAYSNDFDLVISVANSQADTRLASTSNYGYQLVDFAAPGENLLSTWINDKQGNAQYYFASGTSMSTPLVSATLAALMQKYQYSGLPPAAFRAALINSLKPSEELQSKLRYSGILDTGAALEKDFNALFKATWFNFEWIDSVDALYLKGYLLDDVTHVYFHNKKNNDIQELDFSFSKIKQGLFINLPDDWQDGYLLPKANQQALEPLDFTLMASKSLPNNDIAVCEGDDCSLVWKKYNLTVTRKEGDANSNWWLSNHVRQGKDVIIITGTNLSAAWQFNFSGQPRLQLSAMQADKQGQGLQYLTSEEGFVVSLEGSSANWYLDNPEDWVVGDTNLQQLILYPHIESQVSSDTEDHCYIATAVYADPYAPEVMLLREFRDKFLMNFYLGQKFVALYYNYSPSLVEWMDDKPQLQKLVRWWLNVFVSFIHLFLSNE